jgi:hypothetical protein
MPFDVVALGAIDQDPATVAGKLPSRRKCMFPVSLLGTERAEGEWQAAL